jgi:hypothetical protein
MYPSEIVNKGNGAWFFIFLLDKAFIGRVMRRVRMLTSRLFARARVRQGKVVLDGRQTADHLAVRAVDARSQAEYEDIPWSFEPVGLPPR